MKTVKLLIPDMPQQLQARAKAAAAMTGVNLKDWVKVAIQEKLNRETYEDGDYEIDQFGRRCLKK